MKGCLNNKRRSFQEASNLLVGESPLLWRFVHTIVLLNAVHQIPRASIRLHHLEQELVAFTLRVFVSKDGASPELQRNVNLFPQHINRIDGVLVVAHVASRDPYLFTVAVEKDTNLSWTGSDDDTGEPRVLLPPHEHFLTAVERLSGLVFDDRGLLILLVDVWRLTHQEEFYHVFDVTLALVGTRTFEEVCRLGADLREVVIEPILVDTASGESDTHVGCDPQCIFDGDGVEAS